MGIKHANNIRLISNKKNIIPEENISLKQIKEFKSTTSMGDYITNELKLLESEDSKGWEENIISESSSKKQYYKEPEIPRLLGDKEHKELKDFMYNSTRLQSLKVTDERPIRPKNTYAMYEYKIPFKDDLYLLIRNTEYRDTGEPDYITTVAIAKDSEVDDRPITLNRYDIGIHTYYELYDFRYSESLEKSSRYREVLAEVMDDLFKTSGINVKNILLNHR